MGSGDRVKFNRIDAFGIGVTFARFPFSLTVNVIVAVWCLSIGFGKGYDQ